MLTQIRMIPILIVTAALATCRCLGQTPVVATANGRTTDTRLFEEAAAHVVTSAKCTSESLAAIDKMLAESKDKISASFSGAKLAWLQGRSSMAITVLEDAMRRYGDLPNGQETALPVAVTGNLWLGTIARHCGDAERAMKAYEDIVKYAGNDEKRRWNVACSYFREAEIADVILGRKDQALELLRKIKQMPPFPANQGGDLFAEWVDYRIAVIEKGVERVQQGRKGSPKKTAMAPMTADAWLTASGIVGRFRSDFGTVKRSSFQVQALELASKTQTSPIDRSLSLLYLGYGCDVSKQPAEAEKYYREVFAGDSFFAPEGGIYLAGCQQKQGRIEESAKTLGDIKKRFPGYAEFVDSLRGTDLGAITHPSM